MGAKTGLDFFAITSPGVRNFQRNWCYLIVFDLGLTWRGGGGGIANRYQIGGGGGGIANRYQIGGGEGSAPYVPPPSATWLVTLQCSINKSEDIT